jgi:hypothetical protein
MVIAIITIIFSYYSFLQPLIVRENLVLVNDQDTNYWLKFAWLPFSSHRISLPLIHYYFPFLYSCLDFNWVKVFTVAMIVLYQIFTINSEPSDRNLRILALLRYHLKSYCHWISN